LIGMTYSNMILDYTYGIYIVKNLILRERSSIKYNK
jgi:hypothetical protein